MVLERSPPQTKRILFSAEISMYFEKTPIGILV